MVGRHGQGPKIGRVLKLMGISESEGEVTGPQLQDSDTVAFSQHVSHAESLLHAC